MVLTDGMSGLIVALAVLVIAGCGTNYVEGPSPSAGPIVDGQLVGGTGPQPGAIKGVYFRTASQSGFTDANGTFHYVDGESVTFKIADVELDPVRAAPLLSPWQLVGDGSCIQSPELARLLALLYSLDVDADPTEGTELPEVSSAAAPRRFSTVSDADVAALVAQLVPGRTAVDPFAATDLFIAQMDDEEWQQIGLNEFPLTVGLVRSQGVASDGASWFFSWRLGLEKTDLDYNVEISNTVAIPPEQSRLGDNHIGDIDYWNGTLYAPLEDGTAYQHPHVALFDPETLMPRQVFSLPTELLTQGVPWVAVDGPRGVLYVSHWDPTAEIYIFDLATVTYLRTLSLRPAIGRVQGAKVFEGSLYAPTDDTAKNIFKINLDTGTVIPLFALNQNFEEEGLVFLPRPDGSLLHTLNVENPARGTELRHHQRTRLPLRQSVCP